MGSTHWVGERGAGDGPALTVVRGVPGGGPGFSVRERGAGHGPGPGWVVWFVYSGQPEMLAGLGCAARGDLGDSSECRLQPATRRDGDVALFVSWSVHFTSSPLQQVRRTSYFPK